MPRAVFQPEEEIAPTIKFSEQELPELKKWKVGKQYRLILDVEQIAMDKGFDGNEPLGARFRVIKARAGNKSSDNRNNVKLNEIKRRTYS